MEVSARSRWEHRTLSLEFFHVPRASLGDRRLPDGPLPLPRPIARRAVPPN